MRKCGVSSACNYKLHTRQLSIEACASALVRFTCAAVAQAFLPDNIASWRKSFVVFHIYAKCTVCKRLCKSCVCNYKGARLVRGLISISGESGGCTSLLTSDHVERPPAPHVWMRKRRWAPQENPTSCWKCAVNGSLLAAMSGIYRGKFQRGAKWHTWCGEEGWKKFRAIEKWFFTARLSRGPYIHRRARSLIILLLDLTLQERRLSFSISFAKISCVFIIFLHY